MTASNILQTNWITEESIIDAKIVRLNYAYPILELGFEKHLSVIMDYLCGFGNLKLSGRNARFVYSWIHNMLHDGKEIVKGYSL